MGAEPEQEDKLLYVTDNAVENAKEIRESQGLDGYGVRIYIQQGGCSGYSYGMQFDDEVAEDDFVVEKDGVKFIVDEHSAELLEGSTVDYEETLTSAGFDIKNPNAKSSCGCGESFQV